MIEINLLYHKYLGYASNGRICGTFREVSAIFGENNAKSLFATTKAHRGCGALWVLFQFKIEGGNAIGAIFTGQNFNTGIDTLSGVSAENASSNVGKVF